MECFESSIFLRCLKKLRQVYLAIEEKISSVYLGSSTHRLIRNTIEAIKIGFKFSIFGRLTEIEQDVSRNFFETSKATRIALNWMRNSKDALIAFSAPSTLVTSLRSLRYDFFSRSLKFGSITIITTVTVNVILSIILQKQISLWGWVMRGLLLFIGINGLFCNVDWSTLKRNSIFLSKGDISQ